MKCEMQTSPCISQMATAKGHTENKEKERELFASLSVNVNNCQQDHVIQNEHIFLKSYFEQCQKVK